MRLTHALNRQHRLPCFPQLDIIFRALVYERAPPFVVIFSHQPASYSNVLFTHPRFVPAADIFGDFPSGCPNPCCADACEMIRFPRRGPASADVVPVKRGRRGAARGPRVRARQMCNWIDCAVAFDDGEPAESSEGSEGSLASGDGREPPGASRVRAYVCSKCKLVKYCSVACQSRDYPEHKRVCLKVV
jgi:hypothetical protein